MLVPARKGLVSVTENFRRAEYVVRWCFLNHAPMENHLGASRCANGYEVIRPTPYAMPDMYVSTTGERHDLFGVVFITFHLITFAEG